MAEKGLEGVFRGQWALVEKRAELGVADDVTAGLSPFGDTPALRAYIRQGTGVEADHLGDTPFPAREVIVLIAPDLAASADLLAGHRVSERCLDVDGGEEKGGSWWL